MIRKLGLPILVFSLLVILPVSAASSGFAFFEGFHDRYKMESEKPDSYISVPFHYQNNNYYCGPAALEMVFDYYGEDIPQTEIADVARTYPYVTFTDEMRRAAHFSNRSTSRGDEIPDLNITGYSTRMIGYGAFEQGGLTIDNLKLLIDRKEPVIVLMWWTPAKNYGHYRVVVGYNETHITMHDPWNKDAWGGVYGGANTSMTYLTFLDLWEYVGNWSLLVHPWDVELQIPETVVEGEDFEVLANITYICSTPFDTGQYPASSCNATIQLPEGLKPASGETTQHLLGNVNAGSHVHTVWSLNANETGSYNISVIVKGKVEGSVGPHGKYSSYDYEDAIGGSCTTPVSITDQTRKVHNLDTGLDYTTIQEAVNDPLAVGGHKILVDSGTYYEHVVVNKSITLIGEDPTSTIIDGGRTGTVVTVVANNVNVTGFTIRNCGNISEGLTTSGLLVESSNNYFARNIIVNNSQGILLSTSNNNTLKENTMINNILNFGVGWNPDLGIIHFLNDIDESNTVNGLPIYYWINQHHKQIPADAGCVYVINSTNILLKNIALAHSVMCFAGTNNSRIENVNCHSGVVCLTSSQNNKVYNNTLENSQLSIIYSTNNIILGNLISDAEQGIYFFGPSHSNTLYHNNFINNTKNVYLHSCTPNLPTNFWNHSVEGNYWSNYTGFDLNHDGIGDSWHEISENNTDHYPLMGPFHTFNTSVGKNVNIISNSTIESLEYEPSGTIRFYVSNMTSSQTYGFCRVSIPYEVLSEPFNVTINGADPTYWNYTVFDNGMHRWIYFEYQHSTKEVIIIPEFPSFLILPLLIMSTMLMVIVYTRQDHILC